MNMLMHPQFDPVALQLGPIAIHWYGITYLVAFALFLSLAKRRLQHAPYADWVVQGKWQVQDVDDLLTYGVMGWFWVAAWDIACFTNWLTTRSIRLKCFMCGKAA